MNGAWGHPNHKQNCFLHFPEVSISTDMGDGQLTALNFRKSKCLNILEVFGVYCINRQYNSPIAAQRTGDVQNADSILGTASASEGEVRLDMNHIHFDIGFSPMSDQQ